MKTMSKKTLAHLKSLVNEAEKVVYLTEAELRALPGGVGRIISASVLHNGYYDCQMAGVKTLYVFNTEAK